MPMAWAFTRICVQGYPQYLRKRRRSFKSTFFYCLNSNFWTYQVCNFKINGNEEFKIY